MAEITVYKNRTNIIRVSLGMNVSADTITSEIRDKAKVLIASWVVSFLTDGIDGELVLRIDDSNLTNILVKSGTMDFKRVSGGEPFQIIDEPITVNFKDVVTL